MTKNEKQSRITKAQARRFEEAPAELARQKRPANIAPRLWQAQRAAAESHLRDLQQQLAAYERLQMGRSKELVLEAVEGLPKALIRARMAAGMTQEGLARRLGVKTQQIQRYKATEYDSASFARIRKVVQGCQSRCAWSGDNALIMGQNASLSWEEFLTPEVLRTRLISTSLFLSSGFSSLTTPPGRP